MSYKMKDQHKQYLQVCLVVLDKAQFSPKVLVGVPKSPPNPNIEIIVDTITELFGQKTCFSYCVVIENKMKIVQHLQLI